MITSSGNPQGDWLRPDETANDLFRRIQVRDAFRFHIASHTVETISFRSSIEVLSTGCEVSEFILGVALEFAAQMEDGIVVHFSTGNNLFNALHFSGVDLSTTPLGQLAARGGLRSITVHDIVQLQAACEILRSSLRGQRCLVLCEGLSPLFLATKSLSGSLGMASAAPTTLRSFHALTQYHNVIVMWVNRVIPRLAGGLREGPQRDPLSNLWRQRISRSVYYTPK